MAYINHSSGTKASSGGEWGPAFVIAELNGSWELVGVQLKDGLVAMLGCDHQDVVVTGILKLQETKKEVSNRVLSHSFFFARDGDEHTVHSESSIGAQPKREMKMRTLHVLHNMLEIETKLIAATSQESTHNSAAQNHRTPFACRCRCTRLCS